MKTVYVNKEGVICACAVEVPVEPKKWESGDSLSYNEAAWQVYKEALQACKESAVPFEDQEAIGRKLRLSGSRSNNLLETFYQIEADWEIVETWTGMVTINDKTSGNMQKKVARLKVSSPEDNKEQDDLWNEVGGIFFRAKGFKAYDHVLKELKEAGFMITRKPLP